MIPIIYAYENVNINDKIPLYGAKKIKIVCSAGGISFNRSFYIDNASFNKAQSVEFPIINGKSPEYLTVTYVSQEKTIVRILIEEFGGKPSATYFEDGA